VTKLLDMLKRQVIWYISLSHLLIMVFLGYYETNHIFSEPNH